MAGWRGGQRNGGGEMGVALVMNTDLSLSGVIPSPFIYLYGSSFIAMIFMNVTQMQSLIYFKSCCRLICQTECDWWMFYDFWWLFGGKL